VGFTSALKAEDRPALTEKLEALVGPPGLHRQCARAAEPLEHRAFDGMGTAAP
jgi:hypothetical protein